MSNVAIKAKWISGTAAEALVDAHDLARKVFTPVTIWIGRDITVYPENNKQDLLNLLESCSRVEPTESDKRTIELYFADLSLEDLPF